MLRFLEGITQQALKFALQYLIGESLYYLVTAVLYYCTVSLDYLQKILFQNAL